MSNVNIVLPFRIDRDRLHNYINENTDHISILEKSVGYVGVNIKIKSDMESKEETTITKICYEEDDAPKNATYKEYLSFFGAENKKYKKEMYNSFLVFESGKTIMSGCSSYRNRKDAYEKFMTIIISAQDILRLNN
jgi:hypothetical protein